MDFLKKNMGRRQFISLGSMAMAAGMLTPADKLLAAQPAGKATAAGDGTKYGRYNPLAENAEPSERGIQMFTPGSSFPGFSSIIAGRMLPPGPMPGHDAPEKHDGEIEYLIHIGNDPDDPLVLGADVDFFMGKGKWLEKYELTKTTAVYLPDGMWHCPWKVKKIHTTMNWVNVRIGDSSSGGIPTEMPAGGEGGAPGGAPGGGMPAGDMGGLSDKEKAAAKTGDYLFDKYLLSGVPKTMKNPVGGKWIAYTDCTQIAGGALTRIIRYLPEKAPYNIIDNQTHEYGSIFFFLGTDLENCTNLGATVELEIGPEKEKHVIDTSAMVYIPKETAHGPFKVTKASGQFNFLEIVAGPELPGAVYN